MIFRIKLILLIGVVLVCLSPVWPDGSVGEWKALIDRYIHINQ